MARVTEVTPPHFDAKAGQTTVGLVSNFKDGSGRVIGSLDVVIRSRARGAMGALASFVGFGLPTFVFMTILSVLYAVGHDLQPVVSAFLGLHVIVVALVANAVVTFGRRAFAAVQFKIDILWVVLVGGGRVDLFLMKKSGNLEDMNYVDCSSGPSSPLHLRGGGAGPFTAYPVRAAPHAD